MKSILAFSLVVLSSTAFAAPAAIGSWTLPTFDVGGGLTLATTMTIAQESVTILEVCSQGGQQAQVSITVPAVVTDSTVTTTGSAQQSVSQNGVSCQASASPGTMSYVMKDANTMTMSAEGQPALDLVRVP